MSYFSTHNHSSYSNIRGLDSINRLDEMIQYANDIGLSGICLTEHEVLSSHLKFLNYYKKLKKEGKIREDFKIGLGNEIYLVHEDSLDELKENINNKNPMTKFYHFLLLAKNAEGHRQLRELSSIAWSNHFVSSGIERVPTFKSDLKRIIKKGDVIATTACLGSFLSQSILRLYHSANNQEKQYNNILIDDFINFCIDVFGKEYFYLEIQPSNNPEQIIVNKALIKLSKRYGLRYTVATDGHYLKKDDRKAHKTYLQSQEAEREVDSFYEATFVQSEEEVREYLPYLSEEQLQTAFDSSMKIYNQIDDYELEKPTIVPTPEIPEYEFKHILSKGYGKYPYIKKFAYSDYPIDRYFLHLVQNGLVEKIVKGRNVDKHYFQKCLDRINTELKEIWLISDKLHERISSYYVLVAQIVDVIWDKGDSIVGVSRGSAGGFLTVYLLDISQMNPLDYDLPHFRHLTAERPELPDKLLSA